MTHRVLVAGLVHETHTFLAQSTDLTGFEALVWVGEASRCWTGAGETHRPWEGRWRWLTPAVGR